MSYSKFRLHESWQTQLPSWHSARVWHGYFLFSRSWSCAALCVHGAPALSDKLEVFSCLGWSFLIRQQFFCKSEKAKLTSFHVAVMQGNVVVSPWSHISPNSRLSCHWWRKFISNKKRKQNFLLFIICFIIILLFL